jgi:hypothetical protein
VADPDPTQNAADPNSFFLLVFRPGSAITEPPESGFEFSIRIRIPNPVLDQLTHLNPDSSYLIKSGSNPDLKYWPPLPQKLSHYVEQKLAKMFSLVNRLSMVALCHLFWVMFRRNVKKPSCFLVFFLLFLCYIHLHRTENAGSMCRVTCVFHEVLFAGRLFNSVNVACLKESRCQGQL